MKTELKDIFLISTKFKRGDKISDLDNKEALIKNNIKISHAINDTKDLLLVEFDYNVKVYKNKKDLRFYYSATYIANFKISDIDKDDEELHKSIDRFSNINAAAIIYPFVRENAATISSKAGMTPFLVPVMNFIKMYEDKVEN